MHILLLHEIGHTAMYLLLVVLIFHLLRLKKLPLLDIIIGYITTIALDADHLIDYFVYKKSIVFNLREFFSTAYFDLNGKIWIIFHAWEWVALTLFLFLITRQKHKVLVFIAGGIAAQLIFDTLSYGFDPKVYFITYRIIQGFSQNIFVPVLY